MQLANITHPNSQKHIFMLMAGDSIHVPRPRYTVPLGVCPKNENKLDEIVDIMSHHITSPPVCSYIHYTVTKTCDSGAKVVKHDAKCHPVLIGGDQLTVARAR